MKRKHLSLEEILRNNKRESFELIKKYSPYFTDEQYVRLYKEEIIVKNISKMQYVSFFDDECVSTIKKFLKDILCIKDVL